MIIAKDLTKEFERTVLLENGKKKPKSVKESFYAVDHLSFSVKQGEIVGVLGPNGAGKTTLLRMLGSLMEPTEGYVAITRKEPEAGAVEVGAGNAGAETGKAENADPSEMFDETDLIKDPVELKASIGYLSGNTKLYHRMSTREMLMMMAKIYEIEEAEAVERIEEITNVLDMKEFVDNRIERLSTGQTQRASIARCLIHRPNIYIFDEPTLGLDILSADAIVSFMKGEKEKGKTVLYSTHYLEEAQLLCDRVLMIYKGKIVRTGTPDEIMEACGAKNLRDAFHVIMKGAEE